MGRRERAEERMLWLVDRIRHAPFAAVVAWHEDDVDEFVTAFPEAEATLRVYTMGPNSSPMLNRAAKRAEREGYLRAGRIGNMDARQYNQRTWCRVWRWTGKVPS